VRVVVEPRARDLIEEKGGAVYVWVKGMPCCRVRTFVLECSTEPPDQVLELVHAADAFQIFATRGLRLPDELHLELDRRGRLGAFWNGQAWIG
jgi:hypothetical protein